MLNYIRYIIAIPCGFVGGILFLWLWHVFDWFDFPFNKILWIREITNTAVYCVSIYGIVHYIVPHYKRVLANSALLLYALLTIIATTYITGKGYEPQQYTEGFVFQIILGVAIIIFAIYMICQCSGNYKDAE